MGSFLKHVLFSPQGVIQQWNGLSGQVVESPSGEMFKTQLDATQQSLISAEGQSRQACHLPISLILIL